MESRFCIGVLLTIALAPLHPAAGQAQPTDAPPLSVVAESAAREGDALKAAANFEEVAKQDPSKRPAVAGMLVKLYAQGGNTNKALEWARVEMARNPDPQAYLAGVHAMLGDFEPARAILERNLASEKEPRRLLTLHWQLAEVYEKSGDLDQAGALLETAVRLSAGTAEEVTARQRQSSFRERQRVNRGNE